MVVHVKVWTKFAFILLLSILTQINGQSACAAVRPVTSQSDMIQHVINQYYSVGYASLDLVAQDPVPTPGTCGIQYASMINLMGNEVAATPQSIQAAVLVGPSTCTGFGLCAEIFDTPSPTGWPMSFLSYIALPTKIRDKSCKTSTAYSASCTGCLALKTATDYITWILTSSNAANVLTAGSFAPMPSYVVGRIQSEIFPNIQCAGLDGNYTAVQAWPAGSQAWSIVGGGASVQKMVQVELSNAFNIETSVSVSFLAFNSSQSQLNSGAINFEIRDFVFDTLNPIAQQQQQVMIPVMAGAVVPVYNLEKYQALVFSRGWLSRIFLGTLSSWSDPSLATLNPSASVLPQAPVRFVRADAVALDGVPQVFANSLFSFTNVSAASYIGPNPALAPNDQVWPVQLTPYLNGASCGDKSCVVQICDPGSYFDVEMNFCVHCPLGTFSLETGSLSCQACPPGTYSNVVGAKGCTKCNDVSYQPGSGGDACIACPANTRRYGVPTLSQSTDPNISAYVFGAHLSECMCLAGYWAPETVNSSEAGGVLCLPCPDGATCQGFTGGVQTIPVTQINFWGDPNNPSAFFECEVGHCLAGYNCSYGLTGRFCQFPAQGFYTVAGLVHECKPRIGPLIIFFMVLEILAWIVLVNFACSQFHSLSVDMIMLQTSGYIAKLNLRWNPDLDVIRIVAEFFNFEVGFVGQQCEGYSGWTDYNLFFWQISFPFLSLIVCAFWWLLKTAIKHLGKSSVLSWLYGHRQQKLKVVRVIKNKASLSSIFHTSANFWDYIWIKFLMFFLTWYPVLVFTIFSVFTCEADAYGVEYLNHLPDVECWTNQHWSMIYVACVYIPLVIVAIPVLLAMRLYWGVKADLLNRCSFMESYGWIYSKYRCDYAWWEMVVLLSRALICMIAAFVTVPMVSACLIIFILNVFLCAQLLVSPQMLVEIRFLEIGSLFSCMIQAVAGILLYPSLDTSNQCVGSNNLDELGSICDSNNQYKHVVNILVLIVFSCNLIASIALFVWKLGRNWIADRAVKEVHKLFDIPYDHYDIHLSNILDGSYLSSLLQDTALTSSPEFRERFLDINAMLPYFIMFNHDQSGHYSQHEFARTLNRLLLNFPGLLDWIAQSDRKLVAGFHAFVADYSAYAKEHHNVAFGQIIVTAHRADVLMWLMTCSERNIQTFCRLLLGVASASGMTYFLRPSKLRDQLITAPQQGAILGLKKRQAAPTGGGLVELIRAGNSNLAAEAELCASVCPEQGEAAPSTHLC